jgi:hypothetical protein
MTYRDAEHLMGLRADAHVHEFRSGAKSSDRLPNYHLIPWSVFAKRLADRYSEGAQKYAMDNWKKGCEALDLGFITDRANHMVEHAHRAAERIGRGDFRYSDDDLAAVIWGAICIMYAQQCFEASRAPQEVPSDPRD